jgi:electron transfer flavoprotein alpha subunit
MTILVIAEHDGTIVKPSTLSTLGAAIQLKQPIHIAVFGEQASPVVEALQRYAGIEKILHIAFPDDEHVIAEQIAEVTVSLAKDYSHILAPSTTFGKNILPRVAGCMNIGMISDVTRIIDTQTFERPIYAGNAFATVKSHDDCILMTIRVTRFDGPSEGTAKAKIELIQPSMSPIGVQFIRLDTPKNERPALDVARIIISGGRGLQSKENFSLIEQLADKWHAAIGASRAAVDAGFVPNDYQVGQTGKIVAPELYIAIGISGAIQHLAGMKDSKIIVAINKDADAPIFQVADYGLVGDLFKILPELIAAV